MNGCFLPLTVQVRVRGFVSNLLCFGLKDKSLEGPKPVKISKGIPQSFMVKAEPDAKGAMLTSTGEYAIPAIDAYVTNITPHMQSMKGGSKCRFAALKLMWSCSHVSSFNCL